MSGLTRCARVTVVRLPAPTRACTLLPGAHAKRASMSSAALAPTKTAGMAATCSGGPRLSSCQYWSPSTPPARYTTAADAPANLALRIWTRVFFAGMQGWVECSRCRERALTAGPWRRCEMTALRCRQLHVRHAGCRCVVLAARQLVWRALAKAAVRRPTLVCRSHASPYSCCTRATHCCRRSSNVNRPQASGGSAA
jgi:hypothetical protein